MKLRSSILAILTMLMLLSVCSSPVVKHIPNNMEQNPPISIYIDLWNNELHLLQQNRLIETFKIAPGKDDTPTPVGHFKVITKSKNWGSGFGTRWLGLDVPWGIYGIHGTNKPSLIGQNVSAGCVRMHNEDVERLYELVPIGTEVHIDGPLSGRSEVDEFPPLAVGSRGSIVQLVQNRLQLAGYYDGPNDGIYGKYMELAVKEFQRNAGLPITGYLTQRDYLLLGLME